MKGKFAIGAIVGAVAGVIAGVLTAPKSGKETRADIKDKAAELKSEATNRTNEAKGKSVKAVYKMNFLRGIFFGLGSVLGGTIVVALIIWILSLLAGVFPPLADFFIGITNTVES